MNLLIVSGIALALLFNFVNGLNDAGNSIAIMVATKALSPGKAALLAAAGNFAGPFLLTTAIALTIGTGIIEAAALTPQLLVAALLASVGLIITANLSGLPISSSHALVGALIGAGFAATGPGALIYPDPETVIFLFVYATGGGIAGAGLIGFLAAWLHENVRVGLIVGALFGFSVTVTLLMLTQMLVITGILAILIFIVISPTLGFFAAFLFDVTISQLFRHSRQDRMKRIFQPLQVVAGVFQAIGHGSNDGQHAVGVITALLLSTGLIAGFSVPLWVLLSSSLAIAVGTGFGGWRVVEKVAKKITKIRPYQGFAASGAGGAVLTGITLAGVPVSSTHVISGAIIGVGATRGIKAVRWDAVREIVTAWLVTIPLAIVLAFGVYLVFFRALF